MKTSDLTGAALDWAVEAANEVQFKEGRVVKICRREATFPAWIEIENSPGSAPYFHRVSTSTDWSQGGPIIERERISVDRSTLANEWLAVSFNGDTGRSGPTPLIAAMRCYVASKLGDQVEIPEGLL